jgi:hypothetical protein
MDMKFFFAFVLSMIYLVAHAEDLSSWRDPNVDFREFENRIIPEKSSDAIDATAQGQARYYTGNNLAPATSWSSSTLQNGFSKIRNTNYLNSPNRPAFLRRIPWLYPADGCFARVQLANHLLAESGFESPKTVMAIGNLYMKTPNSRRGFVSWWFHVAPVVQVGDEYLVLDPSVDSSGPISLYNWLDKMGTPSKIKVAVCGPGTSSPGSSCNTTQPYKASSSPYLSAEWNQLSGQGKDPAKLLSNPW